MTDETQALAERLASSLHLHVCGTEYDEWNNPCCWAGEDAEPGLKSFPVCAEVDLIEFGRYLAKRVTTSNWLSTQLAQAWDEGYDMGDPYQRRGNPDEGKHRNPYRDGGAR